MIRSELDVLLERVEDPALREDLRTQIDRLKRRRSFGLVFEQHIPERVRLPQHPIRIGSQVVSRDDADSPTYEVLAIADGLATVELTRDPDGAYVRRGEHPVDERERLPIDSLVVISDFGEPVLPGFRSLGTVERGGDKPYHVVINGENHHALEALRFTHAGKVDCIYIDPPYNSGARDWKYNNDYVDETDAYRHSKWLAFMERRLKLVKELLNPDDSVLIVTIDENERNRLGLLLEQAFPSALIQLITSVINPKGASLGRDFARVDEHLLVVYFGASRVAPEVRDMLDQRKNVAPDTSVKWSSLIRGGAKGIRTDSPGAYYPVFVDADAGVIHSFGQPLPWGADKTSVEAPPGTIVVWPPRHPSGVEGRWGIGHGRAAHLYEIGALRLGKIDADAGKFPMAYLSSGIVDQIEAGQIKVVGKRPDGTLIVEYPADTKVTQPKTVWNMQSHNAGEYGSKLVAALLPHRKFPFPKSLYAVEDAIGFFLRRKPEGVIIDFFAGSGTTAHAVMRLNRQDGGRRQSIMVTNNEVSASEAAELRKQGLRPGDSGWEALGIFEHITRPRVTAAITGRTPDGEPIKGDYKFTDEFPMAEGFEENVAFLELRYLDADDVDLGFAYDDIAPLLWLRAGASGPIAPRTDEAGSRLPYAWTDRYGVLVDEDRWRSFVSACPETATTAFIVTHSQTAFAGIAAELPTGIHTVRLPDSYLSMFLPGRGGG